MKKYVASIILFLVFFLNINLVKAEDYIFSSDFAYTLDSNGNASIVAYIGNASTLTIPSTIDGHKVTNIAYHAFDENNPHNSSKSNTKCSSIKNLVISEGITKVGDFAFIRCQNLETVKLPNSLTELGMQSFLQCPKLKKVNIPEKLTLIQNSTFQETALTTLTLPKNVEIVDSRAFGSCKSLKDVYIYNDNINLYGQSNSHREDIVAFGYSNNIILHGNAGSATERFANEFNIPFVLLNQQQETQTQQTQTQEKSQQQTQPVEIKMTRIILNKTILSLTEGETETLTVSIQPSDATNKDLVWSTSNVNIVKVENGKLTARNAGTAKIKVTNKENTISAECNVTVLEKAPTEIKMTKIEVNKLSLKMKVGDTETIIAKILPENSTEKELIWTVVSKANPKCVKVDNGKITAISKGTAVVSVSNKDKKVVTKINVTVLDADNTGEEIKITKINMNKPSLTLKVGDSETLIAGILPSNATNKELTWISSNTNILTVENGRITAVGAGEAIVTVTNYDKSVEAKSNIKVVEVKNEEVPLKQIVINRTNMSLYVGNEQTLVASLVPGNTTDTEVFWTSNNEKVAKVEDGRVIATGVGKTIITVSNGDKTVNTTCEVTVTDLLDEDSESIIDLDFLKILVLGVGVLLLMGFLVKISNIKSNKN